MTRNKKLPPTLRVEREFEKFMPLHLVRAWAIFKSRKNSKPRCAKCSTRSVVMNPANLRYDRSIFSPFIIYETRAVTNSVAVANRSSGFFAIAFCMAPQIRSGRSGNSLHESGGG